MKTSDIVFDYLVKFGPLRVIDLSSDLDLTPADIRYQLKTLISTGLVEPLQPEPALARGRPAARFVAISRVPVANVFFLLDLFAEQIIDYFPKLTPDEIAELMWKSIKKKLNLSSSPYEKVIHILRFLDSMGVKTSWEAGKYGPKIIIINNPYQIKMNPLSFHKLMDSLINLALREAVKD